MLKNSFKIWLGWAKLNLQHQCMFTDNPLLIHSGRNVRARTGARQARRSTPIARRAGLQRVQKSVFPYESILTVDIPLGIASHYYGLHESFPIRYTG